MNKSKCECERRVDGGCMNEYSSRKIKQSPPAPRPPPYTHAHSQHTREMQVHKELAVKQVLQVNLAQMVNPAKLVHPVLVAEM